MQLKLEVYGFRHLATGWEAGKERMQEAIRASLGIRMDHDNHRWVLEQGIPPCVQNVALVFISSEIATYFGERPKAYARIVIPKDLIGESFVLKRLQSLFETPIEVLILNNR